MAFVPAPSECRADLFFRLAARRIQASTSRGATQALSQPALAAHVDIAFVRQEFAAVQQPPLAAHYCIR